MNYCRIVQLAFAFMFVICADTKRKIVEDIAPRIGKGKENPRVEVRATLVQCPENNEEVYLPQSGDIAASRRRAILKFRGFDNDEPVMRPLLSQCRKKLVVSMKFNNCGKTYISEEYIVINHVIDPVTHQRLRLLNPYVFKTRQGQVLQLYGLKFVQIVNGQAKEEVINKRYQNFMGCDDSPTSRNPTCGMVNHKGSPVPYSQGFCCSCDSSINVYRQYSVEPTTTSPVTEESAKIVNINCKRNATNITSASTPQFHHKKMTRTSKTVDYPAQDLDNKFSKLERKYLHKNSVRTRKYKRSPQFVEQNTNVDKMPVINSPIALKSTYSGSLDRKNQKFLEFEPYINKNVSATHLNLPQHGLYSHQYPVALKTNQKHTSLFKLTRNLDYKIPKSETLSSNSVSNKNILRNRNDFKNSFQKKMSRSVDLNTYLKHVRSTCRRKRNLKTKKKHSKNYSIPIPIPIFLRKKRESLHDFYTKDFQNENDYEDPQNNKQDDLLLHVEKESQPVYTDPAEKSKASWLSKYDSYYHIKINDNENKKESSENSLSSTFKLKDLPMNVTNKSHDLKRLARSRNLSWNTYEPQHQLPDERFKHKRETDLQYRGGQNCADKCTPPYADPATYHDSAHCLRFSDLWYSVYRLHKPFIQHDVYLQLFVNRDVPDGTQNWEDLTHGSLVRVGKLYQQNQLPAVSFAYSAYEDVFHEKFNLDYLTMRLLIPEPIASGKEDMYPQVQGGPGEFLVVTEDLISANGSECDKAGVGYEAFFNQPDRCSRSRGTCLKNQPIDLWRLDIEARLAGKKGHYFLENFGNIPNDPIKTNSETTQQYLGMEFYDKYTSNIDIELNADFNAIVDSGTSGRITEVYLDGTCPLHSSILVIVTNTGLASSSFQVKLKGFPSQAPPEWDELTSPLVQIHPQHVHQYILALDGPLPLEQIYFSVELVNCRQQLVATRRIRMRQFDRCVCVWHCLCACIGYANGFGCETMSPEHYNAAGFQGSLPVTTFIKNGFLMNFILFLIILFLILLLLGATKGILGLCCCPPVGAWGLDVFVEHARKIPHYYENELCDRTVIYDCAGFPVHPDTKLRTVRTISRFKEFNLNLVFFFVYPFAVCFSCCRRQLGTRFRTSDGKTTRHKTKHKTSKNRPADGVSIDEYQYLGYGEEDFQILETADTRYVLAEYRRSKEMLTLCECRQEEKAPLLLSNADPYYGDDVEKGSDLADSQAALLDYEMRRQEADRRQRQEEAVDHDEIMEVVGRLLRARVVYRIFQRPMGGVDIPTGVPYCIRGFFLEADNGYKFITPTPLKQYWMLVGDKFELTQSPKLLQHEQFELDFATPDEVYYSRELSVLPQGFCISTQQQSFGKDVLQQNDR